MAYRIILSLTLYPFWKTSTTSTAATTTFTNDIDETYIEVKEGLSADSQVILTWSNEIYNGADVRTVEEAEGSAADGAEEAQSK